MVHVTARGTPRAVTQGEQTLCTITGFVRSASKPTYPPQCERSDGFQTLGPEAGTPVGPSPHTAPTPPSESRPLPPRPRPPPCKGTIENRWELNSAPSGTLERGGRRVQRGKGTGEARSSPEGRAEVPHPRTEPGRCRRNQRDHPSSVCDHQGVSLESGGENK